MLETVLSKTAITMILIVIIIHTEGTSGGKVGAEAKSEEGEDTLASVGTLVIVHTLVPILLVAGITKEGILGTLPQEEGILVLVLIPEVLQMLFQTAIIVSREEEDIGIVHLLVLVLQGVIIDHKHLIPKLEKTQIKGLVIFIFLIGLA